MRSTCLALVVFTATAPAQDSRIGADPAAALNAALDAAWPSPPRAVGASLIGEGRVLAAVVRGGIAGRPLDPTTTVDVEGLACEFTAALVLRLSMTGTLRLEDPLDAHLGGIPAVWRPLRVRHLLQHASGLPVDLPIDIQRDDAALARRDDLVRMLLASAPRFAPGSTSGQACAADTRLLAALTEAASAREFDDMLRERVLDPASMVDATCRTGTWRDRGIAGVRCSLRDLGNWLVATQGKGLFHAEARAAFFAPDDSDMAPAGEVLRVAGGGVFGFRQVTTRLALLRLADSDHGLMLYAAGDVDMARALANASNALWPHVPQVALGDFVGTFEHGGHESLVVSDAGSRLQVRAFGQQSSAWLLYGKPAHPEWPTMLRDLASHARLHLRPLLARDSASLTRAFAQGTSTEKVAGALRLIADLVDQHGRPGRPEILGSRTLGVNATWVRVPFGKTPITLRVAWQGFLWADVEIAGDPSPAQLDFEPEDGGFVAKSIDGRRRVRLEFDRVRGGVRGLRLGGDARNERVAAYRRVEAK